MVSSPSGFNPGHSRPDSGTFDYILESSNFASSRSPASNSSTGAPGSTSHAYASGPPDAYTPSTNLFPAHEDYGVTGESTRLVPPPMNHSRSYSEGPRRYHPDSGPPVTHIFSAGGGTGGPYSYVPQQQQQTFYQPWVEEGGGGRRGSDAWKNAGWVTEDGRRNSEGWKGGVDAYGEGARRAMSSDGQGYPTGAYQER